MTRKIRPYKLIDSEGRIELGYRFWCPACRALHAFCVQPSKPFHDNGEPNVCWEMSGTYKEPTFTPSLLYQHRRGNWVDTDTDPPAIWMPYGELVIDCHLTVSTGRIYYHGDCPHDFKGETIGMVEFPDCPHEQEALAALPNDFFRKPKLT